MVYFRFDASKYECWLFLCCGHFMSCCLGLQWMDYIIAYWLQARYSGRARSPRSPGSAGSRYKTTLQYKANSLSNTNKKPSKILAVSAQYSTIQITSTCSGDEVTEIIDLEPGQEYDPAVHDFPAVGSAGPNAGISCPQCNITVSSVRVLREHIIGVHQGVHRYSCPYCEKGFRWRSGLRRHKVTCTSNPTHSMGEMIMEETDYTTLQQEEDELSQRAAVGEACTSGMPHTVEEMPESDYTTLQEEEDEMERAADDVLQRAALAQACISIVPHTVEEMEEAEYTASIQPNLDNQNEDPSTTTEEYDEEFTEDNIKEDYTEEDI